MESGNSTALVLVVSRHEEFATAVAGQLRGLDLAVELLTPEEGREIQGLGEREPVVAFVDLDAQTAESFPLYKALANAMPECQIVLICTPAETAAASRLVRLWEVFDYVLPDAANDPQRIPLVIERARTGSLPRLAEAWGFAKQQYGRILDCLAEIRAILKSAGDSPVVKVIRDHPLSGDLPTTSVEARGRRLAEEYRQCLVDLICGRLRRVETEVGICNGILESQATGAGGRAILIVEDDLISAEIAKHILERNGFNSIVATTPETTKEAMRKHRPCLVLMDVHLGAADGLRLVKTMRRANEYSDVPVVVVTADKMRNTLLDAIGADVQGYLLKPYDPKELIAKVKSALDSARLPRGASTIPPCNGAKTH